MRPRCEGPQKRSTGGDIWDPLARVFDSWGFDRCLWGTDWTRAFAVFTITDKCADIRGGGEIVGGPTVVTIASPTSFTREGEAYRYCGTKVQF